MTDKRPFKEDMEKVLIPAVEKMIEKEKAHLEFLKESKTTLSRFTFMWTKVPVFGCNNIDNMIKFGERELATMEARLSEYKQYIKNNFFENSPYKTNNQKQQP